MTTATLPALQQAFHDTENSIVGRSVERRTQIRTMMLCLPGRLHHFQYGEPGTGKSYIVDLLAEHIGDFAEGDYFKTNGHPQKPESELFGVLDPVDLKKGIRRRDLTRTLAVAKFAYITEIWKNAESTSQSMLMITNERQYDNQADGIIDCPLWSLFCDSNEFPTATSLEAIYDRIHVRHVTERIRERGNRITMLKAQDLGPITPTLTVAQVEQAQAEVRQVPIENEVYEALAKIAEELYSEGINVTDRRLAMCLSLIRANAWFHGKESASVEDMEPVRFMLWSKLADIPTVDHLILNLASELEAEALEIRNALDNIADELEQALSESDKVKRQRAIRAVYQRIDDASAEVVQLQKKANKDGRSVPSIEALASRADSLMDRLMTDGLHRVESKKDA